MFTIKWKVTGGSTSSSKKIPPQPRLLINFKNRKWLVYLQIDHYCFSHLIGFCCFLIHFTFLFEEGFSLETLDLVFGIPTYINLSLSIYIYVDLYFNIDFNVYAERFFPHPPPPPFVYLFVCLVGWFSIQWSSIYVFLLCLRENHWWPESSCCTTFTSKLNFTYTWLRFSNVRDILLNSLKIHKNISDVKCGKWCMLVVFMRKVCIMGYYTVSGRYRFYIRAARTISTSERRGEEGLFLSLGHKIHIFKLA